MTKPPKPSNLSDVSTWTPEQMAYAAPIIVKRAAEQASAAYADARELNSSGSWAGRDAAAKMSKIGDRYMKTMLFWQAVQLGESPKIPTFLKAQRVRSYEQTNQRLRPAKTRYDGPKDFGIWSIL